MKKNCTTQRARAVDTVKRTQRELIRNGTNMMSSRKTAAEITLEPHLRPAYRLAHLVERITQTFHHQNDYQQTLSRANYALLPFYVVIFAASTSTCSICGGSASNSAAFAINAAAIRPARCACRPASSGNASKMPNVAGPNRSANQTGVAAS